MLAASLKSKLYFQPFSWMSLFTAVMKWKSKVAKGKVKQHHYGVKLYLDEIVLGGDEVERHGLIILVSPRSPVVTCYCAAVGVGKVIFEELVNRPLDVFVQEWADPLPERGGRLNVGLRVDCGHESARELAVM